MATRKTPAAHKELLDVAKAEVEVRKLTAEAELAELKLAQEIRADEDAAAEYENRIYYFNEDVSQSTVEDCMATIGLWTRRETGPVTLVINSPGGSVYAGLALYDFLRFIWGKVNEMSDDLDQSKRLWHHCATLLAARSTMTVKQLKNRAERKEWWLDADEALTHGFVDTIQ